MIPRFQVIKEVETAPVGWIAQPKLNGVAAAYHRGHFYSRSGKMFPPQRFAHLLRQIIIDDAPAIFGEFWNPTLTLPEISGQCNHYSTDGEANVHFVYYDVNGSGGYERRTNTWLSKMPTTDKVYPLAIVDVNACDPDCIDGTIYRHPKGVFISGPSPTPNIVKVKKWRELDATVVDTTPGAGELTGKVGALVCKYKNIEFTVGSGLTAHDRVRYRSCRPGRVKVRYLNLSAYGIPLNPTFLEEL